MNDGEIKTQPRRPARARQIGRVALIVLTVAVLALLAVKSGVMEHIDSVEELREWISGYGGWAGMVFFLLQMLTVIIAPIPSNVTTLAGALALGFVRGFFLSALAVFAGSVLMFLLARRLGAKFVSRFVQTHTIAKYMPIIEEKRDAFLFITMLLPFFPDDAICIIAGLTNMPAMRFSLITLLTRPWGLLFAALVGSGMLQIPVWGWVVIVVVCAALFILSLRYGPKVEERLIAWFSQKKKR